MKGKKPTRGLLVVLLWMLSLTTFAAHPLVSQTGRTDIVKWLTSSFSKGKIPPFSFVYGDVSSDHFITKWKYSFQNLPEEDGARRFRVSYTDPATGLEVQGDLYAYTDYDAAEWVFRLRNTGSRRTPQIRSFKASRVDIAGNDFRLLYANGSTANRNDFMPGQKKFAVGDTLRLHPDGGRSSDGVFPFFNIYTSSETSSHYSGVVASIGWSGTWQASMVRSTAKALQFSSGQRTFDTYLLPGEQIRTPRQSFMLWTGGDEFSGNNKFRRFIFNHHTHKVNGHPTVYPITAGFNWGAYPSPCNEYSCLTESWAMAVVKQHRYYGIRPEVYWLDAGWYPGARESNWYESAGNWTPDKKRFPEGFKNLSKLIHDGGQKFLVWFEPERVQPGTLWRKAHPGWMLHRDGSHFGTAQQDTDKNSALLNLADPDAVEWASNEICGLMNENGVDHFRTDFNIRPEHFWRANEPEGRKGYIEAKYIEGLYRLWDNILERVPGSFIDNCASGGRRIDLETTSRGVPLWFSDYQFGEPNGHQCHTYGINLWLPQSGCGSTNTSPYDLRSCYGSAVHLSWKITDPANNIDAMAQACEFIKQFRYYYMEDYYPLCGTGRDITSDKEFLALQFDKPSDGTGCVLAFRRGECPDSVLEVRLHGLNPGASYVLTDADSKQTVERTGAELMKRFSLKASRPRTSLLITYKRKP